MYRNSGNICMVKKIEELAAFKVFEIKCYLINVNQRYSQQQIYLNKTYVMCMLLYNANEHKGGQLGSWKGSSSDSA